MKNFMGLSTAFVLFLIFSFSSSQAAEQIMMLQEGNKSSCTLSPANADESTTDTKKHGRMHNFVVKDDKLTAEFSGSSIIIYLTYPIYNGEVHPFKKWVVLGNNQDLSEDEKKKSEHLFRSIPVFATMFSGRRFVVGDLLFRNQDLSWILSFIKIYDGGATVGALNNDVRVKSIDSINGRPTYVARGTVSTAFYLRGNSYIFLLDGEYLIDAQSGLPAGWNFKVSASGVTWKEEDATCVVVGGQIDHATARATPSQPKPTIGEGSSGTTKRSVRDRLEALDRLLKNELIRPEEAAKKREEILRDL